MRTLNFLLPAMLAGLTLGLAGCTPTAQTPAPPLEPPSAEAVVDLTGIRSGRIPVSIRYEGIGTRGLKFASTAKDPEYRYYNVRFKDGQGKVIRSSQTDKEWRLRPFEGDVVEVSYLVQPGGAGRHGAQGAVDDDFVVFDGRLYLHARSRSRILSARVRFILPDGWSVASPFNKHGDWYYLDGFDREATARAMEKSCVGVGLFETATRQLGQTEFRVATFSGWSDQHKELLVDKTFRMAEYFHGVLGFDIRAPYSVVWTPKLGRSKVFGGSYANGTCFEHPRDTLNNWRLLGHRIGHGLNKYDPTGMAKENREENWFEEGWASYIEIASTHATKIAEDESYWNDLYNSFMLGRRATPQKDLALVDEPLARDDMVKEFMHYRKAPLGVKMLEYWMSMRTERTLEEFMKEQWARYGFRRGRMPLLRDLEAFTGAKFDDYWAAFVVQRGDFVPIWPEFLTDEIRENMNRPAAAHVGRTPLAGDYLHYLASSGDFEDFGKIREHLIAEERRRAELDALGIRLYPPELRKHLYALPGKERLAVAHLESNYPEDLWPDPPPTGTRPKSSGPIELTLDRENIDGRVFSRLLELEKTYETQVSRGPLESILIRGAGRKRWDHLGFLSGSRLLAATTWREPPTEFTIEILRDGEVQEVLPGLQGRSSTILTSLHLPAVEDANGVLAIRVRVDGKPVATRSFWQRGQGIEPKIPDKKTVEALRRRREAARSKARSRSRE